jgi:threonine dehydrogenase-like Zn-dependent dehydrogenase
MRAVTFQAPGEVQVDEVSEPELLAPDDAIVRVHASSICGSDLHIYHGRVQIEPGFVIGHEFVGEVVSVGDEVSRVATGDRVLGTYGTACGECFFCLREEFHKCDEARVFGHGKALGSLQGAQAELLLVPHANLTLRKVPDGLTDDVALFAGDVMGTAYHAIDSRPLAEGETAAILGMGPVGLCAVQAAKAAGASQVVAIDTVEDRLRMAVSFGAARMRQAEAARVSPMMVQRRPNSLDLSRKCRAPAARHAAFNCAVAWLVSTMTTMPGRSGSPRSTSRPVPSRSW